MSWIALGDRSGLRLGTVSFSEAGASSLMLRGTLVIEATIGEARDRPIPLLHYRASHGWQRLTSLILYPEGRVELTMVQGASVTHGDVALPLPAGEQTLRISYGWEAPLRRGFIALELPDAGLWARAAVEAPSPLPWDDLAAVLGLCGNCARSREVTLVALSDALEPVGPVPGIAAGTPVRTAAGWKPVEQVEPGDLVCTAWGGLRPVLARVSREMPALGRHAPVRLNAPLLGLRQDVTLCADHHMLVAGSHAEFSFGEEAVLVPARHFARMPHDAGPRSRGVAGVRYHQLLLQAHDCLSLAGAWGESISIPAGARLEGTVFEGLERVLPRQGKGRARPLLPFEARELRAAMGA